MRRRRFMQQGAVVGLMELLGVRWWAAHDRVDRAMVRDLADAAERLEGWDRTFRPHRLRISAVHAEALTALERSCPPELEADLRAVVGEILHTVGYIAWDRGDLGGARRAFGRAEGVALEAGGGVARSLSHRAQLSLARTHLTPYGSGSLLQPQRALELAAGVEDRGLTATERALAWQVQARAHAVVGDRRATERAVGKATERREQSWPEADPPWVASSGLAEHRGDTGHALAAVALGEPDPPVALVRAAHQRLIDAAQDPQAHHRTRVFSRLVAARLSLRFVDRQQAVEIATPALKWAPLAPSAQTVVLAHELRDECLQHLEDEGVCRLYRSLSALVEPPEPLHARRGAISGGAP